MAYYLVLGGTSLYRMNTAGSATALTLPSGVSVISGRRPRFAVLNRQTIATNAFTRSLLIDQDFNVYPLQLRSPASAPVLTAASSGGLSGNFRVKYTHIIKDPSTGALLAESQFSPASAASGVIASKLLKVTVETSPDAAVTHRRLYRTTTGPGTTYFPWFDIDGNVLTSGSDDLSDASLQLVAAPTTLGAAPGLIGGTFMTLCAEWKDRIWGVGDVDVDTLRYTDVRLPYAWKSSYEFQIPPIGFDQFGITAIIPRRDELGVFKRNFMVKIVGDTATTFERIKVHNGKGCYGPETAVVINDTAYFLGEDGVYTWGPEGIQSISNGKVRKWFTSDTYFNRAQFPNAFAEYNAKYHGYELHLAAAGSSDIDRWVFYDIDRQAWWGPHKTAAFTPTCGLGFFIDSNNVTVPVVGGSNGVVYTTNNSTFSDNGSAIALSATSVRHSADTPNVKKLFGRPSVIFAKQAAAGNLVITANVGSLAADSTRILNVDQTNPNRQRFSPLGIGEYCQFVFTESTLNQACRLYGYELDTDEVGIR